jgi:hypothetical protein
MTELEIAMWRALRDRMLAAVKPLIETGKARGGFVSYDEADALLPTDDVLESYRFMDALTEQLFETLLEAGLIIVEDDELPPDEPPADPLLSHPRDRGPRPLPASAGK